MNHGKRENKKSLWGFCFLACGLVLLAFLLHSNKRDIPNKRDTPNKTLNRSEKREPLDARVNYHLRELERRQNKEKLDVQFENSKSKTLSIKEHGYLKKKFSTEENGVRFDEEVNYADINDNLDEEEEGVVDGIRQQLQRAYEDQEYNEAYKKAYIHEFVENARREGFEVSINDDLEVVRVRRIREPSGYRSPDSVKEGQTSGVP